MNFTEVFIRRPVMTVLLSASAVVAGIFAYDGIPIAALPQFDTPTIQVTAVLPGASPENMASSVATPLEKQFATISDVDVISSSSSLGQTQVTLEFAQDRDIDKAAVDVQAALFRASRFPGTKRIGIPGVSHWLMLDDPEATARAFEEVLH